MEKSVLAVASPALLCRLRGRNISRVVREFRRSLNVFQIRGKISVVQIQFSKVPAGAEQAGLRLFQFPQSFDVGLTIDIGECANKCCIGNQSRGSRFKLLRSIDLLWRMLPASPHLGLLPYLFTSFPLVQNLPGTPSRYASPRLTQFPCNDLGYKRE